MFQAFLSQIILKPLGPATTCLASNFFIKMVSALRLNYMLVLSLMSGFLCTFTNTAGPPDESPPECT